MDPTGISVYLRVIEWIQKASDPDKPRTMEKTTLDDMYPLHMSKIIAVDLQGRKLSVTRSGYFGLVPEKSQVGDRVTIIPGLKSPAILRETDRSTHTIVGGALIGDMMDREALKFPDCETRMLVLD
jgi:hypothetical protein